MEIGDVVRSKTKWVEGEVVSLIKASFYIKYMLPPGIDLNCLFEGGDWASGNLAVVLLDAPQRSATKEEWVERGMKQGFKREDLENNYETQCPVVDHLVFPVGELTESKDD